MKKILQIFNYTSNLACLVNFPWQGKCDGSPSPSSSASLVTGVYTIAVYCHSVPLIYPAVPIFSAHWRQSLHIFGVTCTISFINYKNVHFQCAFLVLREIFMLMSSSQIVKVMLLGVILCLQENNIYIFFVRMTQIYAQELLSSTLGIDLIRLSQRLVAS